MATCRFGENERTGSSTGKSGKELLIASFNHMRHPYQLLVIPLTMWSGVEQAFLSADYTAVSNRTTHCHILS